MQAEKIFKEFRNSGYKISNTGIVMNKRGKILKPYTNGQKEYLKVCLRINFKSKYFYIHRLVAELFIKNDYLNTAEQVDHLNKDKTNNHVSNLEIVTNAENLYRKYNGYNKTQLAF
ncbi:MAG: HNH endonuclease [Ignavibacteriae bacterium]|nr:MAG: HNH endonuclease [Ignavibacteriota bacterium]